MHDPGQVRVHEPRAIGKGPGRAFHHPGCGGEGALAARRNHRRGDGGQYRDRAGAGRGEHGVSHGDRDPGNAEPGKERHAAAGGGRARPGARRTLPQPQQLRALFRAAGRGTGQDRGQGGDLGQSVRQCGEPSGPYRDDGAGNLGTDRRQAGRVRLRRRLWRHSGRGGHGPAGQGRQDRAGRSGRGSAAQLLYHRQAGKPGHVDYRRHRAGADHGQPRRLRPGFQLAHTGCRGAAHRVRPADRGRALHGRIDRDQHRGRDPDGTRDGAGQDHRHDPLRLWQPLSVKGLHPTFLREKGLPVPGWLDQAARPIPAVFEDA